MKVKVAIEMEVVVKMEVEVKVEMKVSVFDPDQYIFTGLNFLKLKSIIHYISIIVH